jgi:acyl-CoA synthetase (NDP forming)
MGRSRLDALLNPRTIAIVGASDRASSWTQEIYSNLKEFGYPGKIYPVNPRRPMVWSQEAYKSLKDLPDKIDLAVIAIPASSAVDAVSACGAAGIHAAMVVSSGFRDAGASGAEIQDQLVATTREGDVAVLGPNVEGFINYTDRVAAYGAEMPPRTRTGTISMFSQSGTAAWTFAHMASDRDVGLRLVTGVGVEATLGVGDLLSWAAADPQTTVGACYIETIRDLPRLSAGFEAMAQVGKRVVVCCPRVSGEAAMRSVVAHTGELLGDTTLRDAFLRRLGAVVVHDPIALFETALLLEAAREDVRGTVAVAMQSGGNCTLFADALNNAEIGLQDFKPETNRKIAEILPEFSEPRNPLDVTGQAVFDYDIYCGAISALAEDPDIGVVVIDIAPSRKNPDGSQATHILKHAALVRKSSGTPVISVLATPLSYPGRTAEPMNTHGVVVLQGHAPSAAANAGLLRLGIETPEDAKAAAQAIQDRAMEIGVDGSRVLIQQELAAGPEILIGITVDPLYGPAMTVRPGGGGVSGISKFHLLPLREGEAAQIGSEAAARSSAILSKAEAQALTDVVERFAWLGIDQQDWLLEIEANPIIITGGRAVAVDALAVGKVESGGK